MLKIPLPQIIDKLKQATSLSEEELNAKIDDKLKQLSGLISKEGAAHIIANELGVKLFEGVSGKLQIKNILAGMRSVETLGKVTRVFELREFQTDTRQGKVASMFIGDETGTIRITMWGDQAENIRQVKEGDIVKIIGGYVRENQGRTEVHLNDRSRFILNPPGETVGEVAEYASQFPKAVRKSIKDLADADQNVEILGTIVQVFEPRFFEVHPDTGKRIRPNENNEFIDDAGKSVTPDYSYVMNVVLDDGTENIRCTFFRNQIERLLSKTKEEMLKIRENPQEADSLKTSLLGEQVKLVGRAKTNDMFNRLEFTANLVFTNPDPEEEKSRLNETQKTSTAQQEQVSPQSDQIQTNSETAQVQQSSEELVTEEVERIN